MPKEHDDSLEDIIANKPNADDRLDGNAPAEPFGEDEPKAGAGQDDDGAEPSAEAGDEGGDEPKAKDAKGKDKADPAAGLTKGITAERTKRQQAEKERDDLRKRLEALERGQAQPQPQPQAQPERPDPRRDPEGAARWDAHQAEERAWNDRVELTQSFMKRTVGAEEYQAKEDAFLDTYKNDPAMLARLRHASNPAEFAYEEGRKILAQREIGDDPAAYRERIRSQLLEDPEFLAEAAKKLGMSSDDDEDEPKQTKPRVPTSLGNSTSAAPRSTAKQFDGDVPLADILSGVGTN